MKILKLLALVSLFATALYCFGKCDEHSYGLKALTCLLMGVCSVVVLTALGKVAKNNETRKI